MVVFIILGAKWINGSENGRRKQLWETTILFVQVGRGGTQTGTWFKPTVVLPFTMKVLFAGMAKIKNILWLAARTRTGVSDAIPCKICITGKKVHQRWLPAQQRIPSSNPEGFVHCYCWPVDSKGNDFTRWQKGGGNQRSNIHLDAILFNGENAYIECRN